MSGAARERWARVKAIFQAAVAEPPAARAALVAEAAAGDEALAEEVWSLLSAHEEAGSFIDTPALGLVRARAGMPPGPGTLVGAYRIEAEVGRGGMGTVYQAVRADDAFRKRVAIKVITRGMDTDAVVGRFRRERQTLATLDHPTIARLLDGGSTSEGVPYFVMEFVDGVPIDAYCDAHALDIDARLALFAEVSSAVAYAHQNLVVHRDLKPDNILVDATGRPRLVDFGIARMLGPDGGALTATRPVTAPGERLMTPGYASPELQRGDPVTTSVDVYSLGVVLYELLARVRPWTGEERGTDAQERLPRRPSEAAVPPGNATPAAGTAWRRRLTGDLDTIVLKALHPDPGRRYGSVQALEDDLDRHRRGLPVTARPDAFAYRAGKFVRRHRTAVAAAAMVAVTLVAAAAGMTWQSFVARAERDRARLEADKAERVSAVLRDMLRAADPGASGREVTVASVLGEAVRRVDAELGPQPEVAASVRQAIGDTYASLGLFGEAEAQLRQALETRRALLGDGHPDVALTRLDLAAVLADAGRLDEALADTREALGIYDRRPETEPLVRAEALDRLGQFLRRAGRDEEAAGALSEALAIRRAALPPDAPAVAESLNNLAVLHQSRGELATAEGEYREALDIARRVHGETHPDVAAGLSNLANVLHSQGRLDDADPLYREALALRVRMLGADHPDVQITAFNYADLEYTRGDFLAARQRLDGILANRGGTLPEAHPVVAAALLVRGQARMALGDLAGAESDIREALALRQAHLPPGHWLTAIAESVLGECLWREGRPEDARPLLEHGYQRLLEDRGPDHERTREARARLNLVIS